MTTLRPNNDEILWALRCEFDASSLRRTDHQDIGGMRNGDQGRLLAIPLKTPRFVGMNEMSIAKRFTNFALFWRYPAANLFLGWINAHCIMRNLFLFNLYASGMLSKRDTGFRHGWLWATRNGWLWKSYKWWCEMEGWESGYLRMCCIRSRIV